MPLIVTIELLSPDYNGGLHMSYLTMKSLTFLIYVFSAVVPMCIFLLTLAMTNYPPKAS